MSKQQPDLGLRGDLDVEEQSRRKAEQEFDRAMLSENEQAPADEPQAPPPSKSDREVLADVLKRTDELTMEFTPVGGRSPIRVTGKDVRTTLCTPTKKGVYPTPYDTYKFLKFCELMGLNPWVRDAYLVGYDTQEGAKFSIITAHQAMMKRGELSPFYLGKESGIVLVRADGQIEYREGTIALETEVLIGGWCRVYRHDREHPEFGTTTLSAYKPKYYNEQWTKDPWWMITKCAEAKAFRGAFPTDLGGMYAAEEMAMQLGDEHDVAARATSRKRRRVQLESGEQTE